MSYSVLLDGHCYSMPKELYDMADKLSKPEFLLLVETSEEIIRIY